MRSTTVRHSITGKETTDSRPPLNYLQSSPVRGQLEPYTEKTRVGWRFLQCTDTPDELKVLLPPRTAQIYSQLLSAEASELAKYQNASWERILEIRRLKERMIRKCGRLSKVWGASKQDSATLFRTVYAPADFRLKEMEKWIRSEEKPVTVRSIQPAERAVSKRSSVHSTKRTSTCCERCASTTESHVDPRPTTPNRRASMSQSNRSSWVESGSKKSLPRRSSTSSIHSITFQDDRHSYSQTVYRTSTAIEDHTRNIHAVLEPYVEKSSRHILPRRRSALFGSDMPFAESPRVLSPDPLPHPYRPRDSKVFAAGEDDSSDLTDEDDSNPTSDTLEPARGAPERDESAPVGESVARPPLLHRRSSLKKSSGSIRASMDATKNVAWAMDQDWQEQVRKYDAAANDAQAADRDWETARATYKEELAGLKALRQNLSHTLAKLRTETEKLQREDEAMNDQETKLRESYKQLEQTQSQYRAKVQAVVDETKSVLSLCKSKRNE